MQRPWPILAHKTYVDVAYIYAQQIAVHCNLL